MDIHQAGGLWAWRTSSERAIVFFHRMPNCWS